MESLRSVIRNKPNAIIKYLLISTLICDFGSQVIMCLLQDYKSFIYLDYWNVGLTITAITIGLLSVIYDCPKMLIFFLVAKWSCIVTFVYDIETHQTLVSAIFAVLETVAAIDYSVRINELSIRERLITRSSVTSRSLSV
ncbi:hypothetical protein HDE_00167 [Halotydeus destructor]|nr:hypothetical protein HDE_00167 [Halotydeus destructor]